MTTGASRLQELSAEQKRRLLARLISKDKSERRFPLSFSQQRLWFLHKLSPDSAFYNVEAAIPIRSSINSDALRRAINQIVQRHEVMRTVFQEDDGQPSQVVLPTLDVDLPVIDLRRLSDLERNTELLRQRTEVAQQPYDLSKGPLLRTKLILLGDNESLFLVGMHHIVCDGWSMGIFGRELTAFYTGLVGGHAEELLPLSIQYGDFALWQRKWLSGENLKRQLEYWQTQLRGIQPLELPVDRVRAAIQTYKGAFYNFSLGEELSRDLAELTRREGVTLFMTLLAAFKLLLFRYSGQTDVSVGTYIANRNRAEIEPLIGFFLNTLVLRSKLSVGQTFLELLREVREVALGAYAHQDLPFEMLVEELHPARDLSRNPLFQITFQLSNAPTQSSSTDMESLMDSKRGTAIFDLACLLFENANGLSGQIEYSSDLYDESSIERMVRHFKVILQEAVAKPDGKISEIPILESDERNTILFDWNETSVPRASDLDLIEQFELIARKKPQSIAFYCGHGSLTYQELSESSTSVARLLRAAGVARSSIVACCMERSLQHPVALLGTLKAGLVYLPLDPSYPVARLEYMLEDSRADVLLKAGPLPEGLSVPPSMTVLDLLEVPDVQAIEEPQAPQETRSEEDLAYIIYTSGSTGVPKGIAATYRQILSRFEWMWRAYPFGENEVSCQKTALGFIDSIWELMGPLLRGVPSVIIKKDEVAEPRLMVSELATFGVTRIWLVPSLLETLLDVTNLRGLLPRLNFWVSSGEALNGRLLRKFRRAMPGARLYNLYGTSETWDATWFDSTDLDAAATTVPIGRPIDNVQVYVLDHRLEPVPVGVAGELVVAGEGLSQGYLNRTDWTAERFVRLPFREDGALGYRTGDVARFLQEGTIEYLGRSDHQIKIRGFRVEPAEIEIELAGAPGVLQSAVIAQRDGSGEVSLSAYLVTANGYLPSAAELRRFLKARLPEFMIPGTFVKVDDLPLTPSGKLDRRALQIRGIDERLPATEYVEPRNEREAAVISIWTELLQRDRIGALDNFFDLGGHSLLATQVISRLQKRFGLQLSLQTFFEAPTVADLAEKISKLAGVSEVERPVRIPLLARSDYLEEE